MSHISDDNNDIFSDYALGGAFAICLVVILTIFAGIVGFIWWIAWKLF